MVIEVSVPSSMTMLQDFPVETVVGSHLQAAVTMKALDGDALLRLSTLCSYFFHFSCSFLKFDLSFAGAYFYRCDAFRPLINWKAGNETFTIVNVTGITPFLDRHETVKHHASIGSPCSWISVYASGSGRTMLQATLLKEYQHFDHSYVPTVLKASMRIAAYLPLNVQQAGDGSQFGGYWFKLGQAENKMKQQNLNKLYLVPGTHMDILLVGGPERWDEAVEFIETFEMSDESQARDGIDVHLLSGSNGRLYGLSCQKLGNYVRLHVIWGFLS